MGQIRTLIVDDSAVVRQVVSALLSEAPGIEVLAACADPLLARDAARAALEQRHAELRLQLEHLLAHGRLRRAQLARGGREARETGGRFERAQRLHRR